MRILIVSNPAHGQINPLLAISHELLSRGHEVHICSADRLSPRVKKLADSTKTKLGDDLVFHGIGDGLAVEDLTPYAHSHPETFHTRARHRPGDLASYVNLVCDITSPGDDEYKQTVFRVRDVVQKVAADIVVVDNFSPFAIDGVRLSGAKYIQTSPGASCAVAHGPSLLKYPHPLSGASGLPSSRSGLSMLWRNLRFVFWFVRWCSSHPFPKARREFRYNVLGLKPVDYVCDSFMTPVPGMVKEMVACLSFNVAGLDLYGPEVYDPQVFFVGPCFAPGSPELSFAPISASKLINGSSASKASEAETDEVKRWLDEAHSQGGEVVYVNFGSIFYYTAKEYEALINALKAIHEARPTIRAIIKVPKLPQEVQPLPPSDSLPSFIYSSTWIPSIHEVLIHPATKIAVHHGGGNSFNEAVYYGLPQLIISQWGETHDIASYGVAHGIAKGTPSAPTLVKEEIAHAIEEILKDYNTFKANALRWRIRCAQAGGTAAAANVIEAYAADQGVKEVLG